MAIQIFAGEMNGGIVSVRRNVPVVRRYAATTETEASTGMMTAMYRGASASALPALSISSEAWLEAWGVIDAIRSSGIGALSAP